MTAKRPYRAIYIRSDAEVEHLVVALVREPVDFAVTAEPDGWWHIRARVEFQGDLDQMAQAARAAVGRLP